MTGKRYLDRSRAGFVTWNRYQDRSGAGFVTWYRYQDRYRDQERGRGRDVTGARGVAVAGSGRGR